MLLHFFGISYFIINEMDFPLTVVWRPPNVWQNVNVPGTHAWGSLSAVTSLKYHMTSPALWSNSAMLSTGLARDSIFEAARLLVIGNFKLLQFIRQTSNSIISHDRFPLVYVVFLGKHVRCVPRLFESRCR